MMMSSTMSVLHKLHDRSVDKVMRNGISCLSTHLLEELRLQREGSADDRPADESSGVGAGPTTGRISLFEFPKRKNGSSFLLMPNWYLRVLNGDLQLEAAPVSEVSAAQGDLKYLTLAQLLVARASFAGSVETAAGHYEAHRNFLEMLDERLYICLGEYVANSLLSHGETKQEDHKEDIPKSRGTVEGQGEKGAGCDTARPLTISEESATRPVSPGVPTASDRLIFWKSWRESLSKQVLQLRGGKERPREEFFSFNTFSILRNNVSAEGAEQQYELDFPIRIHEKMEVPCVQENQGSAAVAPVDCSSDVSAAQIPASQRPRPKQMTRTKSLPDRAEFWNRWRLEQMKKICDLRSNFFASRVDMRTISPPAPHKDVVKDEDENDQPLSTTSKLSTTIEIMPTGSMVSGLAEAQREVMTRSQSPSMPDQLPKVGPQKSQEADPMPERAKAEPRPANKLEFKSFVFGVSIGRTKQAEVEQYRLLGWRAAITSGAFSTVREDLAMQDREEEEEIAIRGSSFVPKSPADKRPLTVREMELLRAKKGVATQFDSAKDVQHFNKTPTASSTESTPRPRFFEHGIQGLDIGLQGIGNWSHNRPKGERHISSIFCLELPRLSQGLYGSLSFPPGNMGYFFYDCSSAVGRWDHGAAACVVRDYSRSGDSTKKSSLVFQDIWDGIPDFGPDGKTPDWSSELRKNPKSERFGAYNKAGLDFNAELAERITSGGLRNTSSMGFSQPPSRGGRDRGHLKSSPRSQPYGAGAYTPNRNTDRGLGIDTRINQTPRLEQSLTPKESMSRLNHVPQSALEKSASSPPSLCPSPAPSPHSKQSNASSPQRDVLCNEKYSLETGRTATNQNVSSSVRQEETETDYRMVVSSPPKDSAPETSNPSVLPLSTVQEDPDAERRSGSKASSESPKLRDAKWHSSKERLRYETCVESPEAVTVTQMAQRWDTHIASPKNSSTRNSPLRRASIASAEADDTAFPRTGRTSAVLGSEDIGAVAKDNPSLRNSVDVFPPVEQGEQDNLTRDSRLSTDGTEDGSHRNSNNDIDNSNARSSPLTSPGPVASPSAYAPRKSVSSRIAAMRAKFEASPPSSHLASPAPSKESLNKGRVSDGSNGSGPGGYARRHTSAAVLRAVEDARRSSLVTQTSANEVEVKGKNRLAQMYLASIASRSS